MRITLKYFLAIPAILLLSIPRSMAQPAGREKEIMKIVNSRDSVPRSVFLDSVNLPEMRMRRSNTRQVWMTNGTNDKHLNQLFDIRLPFATHDSALWFHRHYLSENAEGGPEIIKHRITATGADELRVYRGSALVNGMVKQYGLQMYCYLFVVDNYFVKVYICCNIKYKPNKFEPLITDIIRRIKAAK
jgi:hypothetical protein